MTYSNLKSNAGSGVSRRLCLGLPLAGLAAPWLQACGGSSDDKAPAPPDWADSKAVQWGRESIRAALARPGAATTAISVALFADDRVVWREAFGYADREKGVPATVETIFNVGSVSKVVTTLAVLILRDRSKLKLDQPLFELLPSFRMLSPQFTRITVRHLLSHSSGFPGNNMRDNGTFAPYLGYAEDTQKALERSHLKHEPGELAVYCNDGFTIVERLVEAIDGRTFPEFVQQEIFTPLEMHSAGYPVKPSPEGSYVHPYFKGRSLPQEMSTPFATGGIFTNAADMLKFGQMLIDHGVYRGRRIVSAEAIQEMAVNQSVRTAINPAAESWKWGLGWDSVQQAGMNAGGVRAWSKNGGTTFFASEFFVLPELRMAMLIVGSGHDYESGKLAEGLLLRAAVERGAVPGLPNPLAPVIPPVAVPTPLSAPGTAARPGVYASSTPPLQVTSELDGSIALLSWDGSAWAALHGPLRSRTDGNWWAEGNSQVNYRFQTVGERHYLIRRELTGNALSWGESPIGEWLPPESAPLPAAWKARLPSEWRFANDSPESVTRLFSPIVWRMAELDAAPGYLLLENQLLRITSDDQAGMVVKIPGVNGRDLFEISMVKVDVQGVQSEQLHLGSVIFERYPSDTP
ncbi:serine hydrolase domain-containing protein [Ottowia thiooxydans]|uniref:serine hydrolase domain-containing protein n=1 Tax=Ottowia thiooxydans TaxID=219182 RepID=UPI0003FBB272|nr:serine hydrolase domain-containing protein [Ottowia thiooxydans]